MKNRKKRLAGAPMENKSIDEYYSSLPFTLYRRTNTSHIGML